MKGPNENNIIPQSSQNGNDIAQPYRQKKSSRFTPQNGAIVNQGRQDNATLGGGPALMDQRINNLTANHSNELQHSPEQFYQGHITQVSPTSPRAEHNQVSQCAYLPLA